MYFTGRQSHSGERESFTICPDGKVKLAWQGQTEIISLNLPFVARVLMAWARKEVGHASLRALAKALEKTFGQPSRAEHHN